MNKIKSLAITNLALGSTMPVDTVIKAYFSNDAETVLKGLALGMKNPEKLLAIIEQANYEVENDVVLATKSNFGKIQKDIVEQVVTSDNLEFIEANIIDSPAVIGETKECPEIQAAKEMIVGLKQNNLEYSKVA